MYTEKNFRSKKELKAAVAAYNEYAANKDMYELEQVGRLLTIGGPLTAPKSVPRPVRYYQPGPFGGNEPTNGDVFCEGPHNPEPHRGYAACTAKDGVIVKVK